VVVQGRERLAHSDLGLTAKMKKKGALSKKAKELEATVGAICRIPPQTSS
jgi:hypothetical protein